MTSSARSLPHVSVCLCTFKRPDLLQRSLAAVARLETAGQFTWSVVVCDNDRDESAKAVAEKARTDLRLDLIYCVEPVQNISLARNRALANARGDFIAFMDDDEFPEPDWLQQLIVCRDKFNADGILGPVRPHFDSPPPRWIIRGRFCERPEHQTGTVLDWRQTRTGNVLFRRSLIQDLDQPFRPEFGSGGEDQDFFRRMMERGCRFVWCNEAVVHEVVPPARCTKSYFLKRAFLRGQNERYLLTGCSVAKSVLAIVIYGFLLPPYCLFGAHRSMKLLIKLLDHSGKVLAAAGVRVVGEKYSMTSETKAGELFN
jgi:succinoglycan biosynthesis protein ExoM